MCMWFSNFLENALVSRVKPAHLHPHGEVLALDVGCADRLRIRVAFHAAFARAGAFRGAILPLMALSGPQARRTA